MAEYYILSTELQAGYCAIYDDDNFDDDETGIVDVIEGLPVDPDTPLPLEFRMADEVPGLLVPDVIHNVLGYLMVSQKVKQILDESTGRIEFLPFVLMNHRGRVASDSYYIANVLEVVDCVDTNSTVAADDPLHEDWFDRIDRLCLDEDRIPGELSLFRIRQLPSVMIMRNDLRDSCEREGVTGLVYLDLDSPVELT